MSVSYKSAVIPKVVRSFFAGLSRPHTDQKVSVEYMLMCCRHYYCSLQP